VGFCSELPLPWAGQPPLLVIFCVHLTFHHSLPCPISHFPPRFPYAFMTLLCPFWHICCIDTGFECLPLVRLPFWRYCCNLNRLILFSPKSSQALQSDTLYFSLHVIRAASENSSRARTDNSINSVHKLYSLDLGTFRVALLFCSPQRCWHHVIVILSSGTRHLGHALRQHRLPLSYPCPTLRNVGN
jgi:hypothetical protein